MTDAVLTDPPGRSAQVPPLARMRNPVRDYDWGSTTVLAALQGRAPANGPEAELWMGAHPSSPSGLLGAGAGDAEVPLPDLIAADPAGVLGAQVVDRFGPRLPFMLKVLAVERPLSLQVHPDADRARTVHAAAPDGPYVDPFHKPELLYALEPMEALFGFRPAHRAAALLGGLGTTRLAGVVAALGGEGDDAARLHAAFALLVRWPAEDREALVRDVAAACAGAVGAMRLDGAGQSARAGADPAGMAELEAAAGWVRRLAELHPADPLVLAPFLLDLVPLAAGEAVFVPAGVPHAYLRGTGVEVLAGSDNVVRAGLTGKPVDVEELLSIVDCSPPAEPRTAGVELGPAETAWQPPVEDFRLTRVRVTEDGPVTLDPGPGGPQILLCSYGTVTVHAAGYPGTVSLRGGDSAFAAARLTDLSVSGDGELFRASVGTG